jgi:hypothetical protein
VFEVSIGGVGVESSVKPIMLGCILLRTIVFEVRVNWVAVGPEPFVISVHSFGSSQNQQKESKQDCLHQNILLL